MSRLRHNLVLSILGSLLIGCVAGWYLTREPDVVRTAAKTPSATSVDSSLLDTAEKLGTLTESSQEQQLARQAYRLADHELDQAFESAVRESASSPAPKSGPLKEITDRIADFKGKVAADDDRIAKLTPKAANDETAANQLELSKAQLALDEDELQDAHEDLAREGGDPHAQIQRAFDEYRSAQHTAPAPKATSPPTPSTLAAQVTYWLALRDRQHQIDGARQQALNHAAKLTREHNALDKLLHNQPVPSTADTAEASSDDDSEGEEEVDTGTLVAALQHLSDQRKTLAELDRRIQDSTQLGEVYRNWTVSIAERQGQVLHSSFVSFALVLLIVMAAVIVERVLRYALGNRVDRRKFHQMRVAGTIAIQLVAAGLILLVVLGPPNQLSTIIGLATAGLTVVLKDFIVAFFGWFTLMGRNGVRIGDWVEIEGVSGEVVEIGVLKTVVLEMGDWSDTGHPTGRRVSFINKYAIENHFFNFSTAGQWLWDELIVTLPAGGDPYGLALQIRDLVSKATQTDAEAAEKEWERVTHQYGTRPFSAKPAVDLRPSVNGLEVLVRYITRAPQRAEVKSRLFASIVELIHKPVSDAAVMS